MCVCFGTLVFVQPSLYRRGWLDKKARQNIETLLRWHRAVSPVMMSRTIFAPCLQEPGLPKKNPNMHASSVTVSATLLSQHTKPIARSGKALRSQVSHQRNSSSSQSTGSQPMAANESRIAEQLYKALNFPSGEALFRTPRR